MTRIGSISPEPWLAELAQRLGAPESLREARGVHQLRVAAARLNVWLQLGGRRTLRDDLRRVRRLVAGLRDLDVLLTRLEHHDGQALTRARTEEFERVALALRNTRGQALVRALECVPWPTISEAEERLFDLADRVVDSASELLRGDRDPARLHRLRRRVRRARYALEWLGRDASFALELQDALGAWHDVTLEEARLPEVAGTGGDARRNALARESNALLEHASEAFVAHRNRWQDLLGSQGQPWTCS